MTIEEKKLWEQYAQTKDTKIRNKLVEMNIPLVKFKVRQRFHNNCFNHVGRDDLFSLGYIGLIKGIEEYDVNRGVNPSTFLGKKILWNIMDGVKQERWNDSIEGPVYYYQGLRMKEMRNSVGLTLYELQDKTGISYTRISAMENGHLSITFITCQKIANALSISIGEFQQKIFKNDANDIIRYRQHVNRDKFASPVYAAEVNELKRYIKESLSNREKNIIDMYYGQNIKTPGIAKIMGVTSQAASHALRGIISKLRDKYNR